jgi:hypothetical protein
LEGERLKAKGVRKDSRNLHNQIGVKSQISHLTEGWLPIDGIFGLQKYYISADGVSRVEEKAKGEKLCYPIANSYSKTL